MVRQKPNRAGRGFTLAELILVVAIMALMASVAVPRMGWATMGTVQVETTARQFANHLRLTRSLAITHASTNAQGYRLQMVPGSEPYSGYQLRDASLSGPEAVVEGSIEIPDSITCTGPNRCDFNALGNESSGSTVTFNFVVGSDTVVVTVSPIGRITVQ